jgi:hypothetical protein
MTREEATDKLRIIRFRLRELEHRIKSLPKCSPVPEDMGFLMKLASEALGSIETEDLDASETFRD